VLILGAGPSGLALGRELRQRRIDFLILDKGTVGDSWQRMPTKLNLVSPWKWNRLTRDSRHRFAPNAQLTRAEFLDYLREFAAEFKLPVIPHSEVSLVERGHGRFRVHTSRGDFSADIVVNSTGYFSRPNVPRMDGDIETKIARLHYAQFSDAQQILSLAGRNGLVLIVGKRLSAGQTALELFDAGLHVALSHRTPIRFSVDDWLWPLVYRTFGYIETVRLKMQAASAGKLDVRMAGGRMPKLIRSGAIQTFPAIARYESEAVVFENGATLKPAVVIYATGFAANLGFLDSLGLEVHAETGVPLTRNMESVSVPNLFFLGFEMLRNFQSRFLRGIRNDAVVLAATIEQRVALLPRRNPEDLPPINC
jgi:thioredoxin reductase